MGLAALSPVQTLTPAPYAIYANTASNLINGLTIQQNANGSPNVIGGSSVNFVSSGVEGATIGGGGTTNYLGFAYSNSVTGNFGTVGGGLRQNTAGGYKRQWAAAITTLPAAMNRRWAAATKTPPVAMTRRWGADDNNTASGN